MTDSWIIVVIVVATGVILCRWILKAECDSVDSANRECRWFTTKPTYYLYKVTAETGEWYCISAQNPDEALSMTMEEAFPQFANVKLVEQMYRLHGWTEMSTLQRHVTITGFTHYLKSN